MHNFKLVERFTIKKPTLVLDEKSLNCFLYQFKEGGFSIKQFTDWLEGKIIDVFEFTGRFGKSTTCPWCDNVIYSVEDCAKDHKKTEEDVETIKLSNHLYKLQLEYTRNGNYDALHLLMNKSCQYCINPTIKGREGKCAIPESSRNKPRSVRTLGLGFRGFNHKKYGSNTVCILYRRKPINK